MGQGENKDGPATAGKKKVMPVAAEKKKLKKLTIKHMSERALVSAALPHDTDSYETWRKVG
jgi:hypothetical protein